MTDDTLASVLSDMGAGDPALTDDLGFSETLAMGGSMDWNMPDL